MPYIFVPIFKKEDMNRFIEAHNRDFSTALAEVKKGHKSSHWIWYIFPQVAGLGSSYNSHLYAISSLDEAEAFLADSTLGTNLKEICKALLSLNGVSAHDVFADDAKKVRSSMTLFDAIAPGEIFEEVLEEFFNGERDRRTLCRLSLYERVTDALKFIGADAGDFSITTHMYTKRSDNPMHLFSHMYRVMIGCALIAQKIDKPRLGLLAFIGAFIHDLARTNDGSDYAHGRNAAEQKLPRLTRILAKYNITDEEYDIIAKATTYHCESIRTRLSNNCYIASKILKDADALDRCRFNRGDARLNINALHFNESRDCIALIDFICKESRRKNCIHREIPFKEFIEVARF